MMIAVNLAAFGRSKWYEYAARFVFGGLVTVFAGLIAKRYGPGVGGLFLAFPAIFPAAATLLEKHEKQQHPSERGTAIRRARQIVGVDAAGAAMGSVGLAAFALVVWRYLPRYSAGLVLAGATATWLVVAVSTWIVRRVIWKRLRTALHP